MQKLRHKLCFNLQPFGCLYPLTMVFDNTCFFILQPTGVGSPHSPLSCPGWLVEKMQDPIAGLGRQVPIFSASSCTTLPLWEWSVVKSNGLALFVSHNATDLSAVLGQHRCLPPYLWRDPDRQPVGPHSSSLYQVSSSCHPFSRLTPAFRDG